MPSPKLILMVSLVIVVVAGVGYFFLQGRVSDPATVLSRDGDQLVEVANDNSWNLEDLCTGRLMREFSDMAEYSSAIAEAVGKLGNSVFSDGLTGCAESLYAADSNGAIPLEAITSALETLAEICIQLRGSEHTCNTLNLLRETAGATDLVPTKAP